jgi:hypothetical protein
MESLEEKVLRYQRTGNRDEELFQEIYDIFKLRIEGMIFSKISNQEDRKDVASECVIALWKALKIWTPAKGPFAAYFGRAIINKRNDYLERYYDRREEEDSEFLNPTPDETPLDHKKELAHLDSKPSGSKLSEFYVTWNALLKSCENLALYPVEKYKIVGLGLVHRRSESQSAAHKEISSSDEDSSIAITLKPQEKALLARMLVRLLPNLEQRIEPAVRKQHPVVYSAQKELRQHEPHGMFGSGSSRSWQTLGIRTGAFAKACRAASGFIEWGDLSRLDQRPDFYARQECRSSHVT